MNRVTSNWVKLFLLVFMVAMAGLWATVAGATLTHFIFADGLSHTAVLPMPQGHLTGTFAYDNVSHELTITLKNTSGSIYKNNLSNFVFNNPNSYITGASFSVTWAYPSA